MNFAILCSGPSLANYKDDDIFAPPENRIAVNSAIRWGGSFGYWTCLDIPGFRKLRKHARAKAEVPRLLIHDGWDKKTVRTYDPVLIMFLDAYEKVMTWFPNLWWRNKSYLFALAYALSCGARQVTYYGCDLSGVHGYKNRFRYRHVKDIEQRWENERGYLREWIDAAKEKEILVTRCGI